MNRQSLYFTAPRTLDIRDEALPPLSEGQVLVQTLCSAISSGTELLIYRGEAPDELAADETITALGGTLKFPLKYGYAAVGRVVELGPGVDEAWRGQRIFSFNPHETRFVAETSSLLRLPDEITTEDAVFLPNMETAVNLLHDGAPLVGERVAVFGQGIIGLLTTSLLSHIPLTDLITFDRFPLRREYSLRSGASQSLDPQSVPNLQSLVSNSQVHNFDLAYELSGSPAALDQTISLTGFDGRVIIGSWYGTKRASLDLGGRFHRSRIKLICSQVSTLAPQLTGRWTKSRRLDFALQQLIQIKPSQFITHRFTFAEAAQAYKLLDEKPGESVQVILTYES